MPFIAVPCALAPLHVFDPLNGAKTVNWRKQWRMPPRGWRPLRFFMFYGVGFLPLALRPVNVACSTHTAVTLSPTTVFAAANAKPGAARTSIHLHAHPQQYPVCCCRISRDAKYPPELVDVEEVQQSRRLLPKRTQVPSYALPRARGASVPGILAPPAVAQSLKDWVRCQVSRARRQSWHKGFRSLRSQITSGELLQPASS